jgi:predicted anti-sigma-YlaC factor YlaD
MPGDELARRDLRPWLDCRHAHTLMSQRLDAPLGALTGWRLAWHLGLCASCRRVEEQFELLGRATRRLGT